MLYRPQAVTLSKDHLFHRYIIFINIVGSHTAFIVQHEALSGYLEAFSLI